MFENFKCFEISSLRSVYFSWDHAYQSLKANKSVHNYASEKSLRIWCNRIFFLMSTFYSILKLENKKIICMYLFRKYHLKKILEKFTVLSELADKWIDIFMLVHSAKIMILNFVHNYELKTSRMNQFKILIIFKAIAGLLQKLLSWC